VTDFKKISPQPGIIDVSVRKISASRLADHRGPRRSKPRLNALKRKRSVLLSEEEILLEAMFRDDELRAAIDAGMSRPRQPMSVWMDSDQSWPETLIQPCELPAWEKLSERMKIFVGFDVAMEFGWCFTINANISPTLYETWAGYGNDLVANVEQRIRRSLIKAGIQNIAFCYVLETRTRHGKSRTAPHLHGVAICETPLIATKLQIALENALAVGLQGANWRRAVMVRPATVKPDHPMGRFRWVSYITKNAHRYDTKLGKRRVYISRSYTEVARLAWAVRRDDCSSA
jgi:hypothetical protein